MLGWVWGIWEQNVHEIERDWYVLSFAAKWLGEKKTEVYALTDFTGYKKDPYNDQKLIEKLWSFFNEADVIVGHNIDAFDVRKANARFLVHHKQPPKPYKTVDTLKVARRYFKFESNKLDHLGRDLGLGRKIVHTGFDLWKRCMTGDRDAWETMKKYNKQDVELLERVYKRMLPWVRNHPNMNLYLGQNGGCPNCGSRLLIKNGLRRNEAGVQQRYACSSCGNTRIVGEKEKAPKVNYKNE